MTAATATSSNRRPLHQQQQQSDLYMKIVCDPGHERTTRELRDLPRESRERVWADMVGSDHSSSSSSSQSSSEHSHDAEDPMFVSKVLNLMDDELSHLSCEDNKVDSKAWEYALQNTQLAHDPTFRLMFLRAEEYDPTRAAIRVIRHFDHKAMLFGKDKLDQTIRLSDLNGDDLESLSCGGFQFLPVADRGGRLVFMSRYRCFVYKERANMLRALWYMMMSVLENPNTQNIGLVVVGYEVGEYVPVDNELTRLMFRLCRSLPLRYVSSHSCYSESPMQKVMDLVVHMISSFTRLRFRIHHGSHQECRYRLLTMGIPVDYLPVSMNGTLNTENHHQWLQYRIQQEQQHDQQQLVPSTITTSSNLPNESPTSNIILDEEDDEDMMMSI